VAQAGGKGQRPGSGGSLELTALGGHLASLPCGPRLGKLLVLGAVLGVADLSVTVAACLSTRSPLLSPSQLEKGRASALEVRAARAELLVTSRCGHQRSDHGFWAALVDCYRAAAPRSRRDCCDALGVSAVRMAELVALRRQLGDAVRSLGFDVPSDALPPRLETQPLAAAPVCPAVPRSLEEWRLLSAALCGALWPNAAKVRRPVQKYHSTSGGAVEADPDAKELKFQIQVPSAGNASGGNGSSSGSGNSDGGGQGGATAAGWCEERVWVHPASVVFAQRKFPSPWLVFSDLVTTSRPFLRDASEVSPYALLLFGGPLAVDVAKGTVAVLTPATIDAQQLAHLAADSPGWSSGAAWCRFSASPKVAALAGALRAALDALLDRKFKDPSMEVADDPVAAALVRLLVTQGMG
jgi:ATP-dependent RNA helicase DHX57